VGGWDDEDERMLWQLQVEAGAIKALDARCLVKQEMQLLEHVVKQRQQQHQQDSSSKNSTNSLPTGSSAATRDASQDKASRHREPQQQRQQQMLDSLVGIAGQLGLHDRQAIREQVGELAQVTRSSKSCCSRCLHHACLMHHHSGGSYSMFDMLAFGALASST
jgi:hypothetical protein